MNSPVSFILVALAGISAILSIVFFMAWFALGRKPYAMSWALAFLAATFQWIFNFSSSLFPSFEIYWITVNALALVLITLGLRGHCQRTDCRILPANLWPYSAAILAVIAWATVVEPNVGLRMALVPASAAVTLALTSLIIVRHREDTRPAEYGAAIMIGLFAVVQAVVATIAALQGPAGDDAYFTLYMQVNFLTLPAGYAGMAIFVIFMMTSDLSEEMKTIAVRDQLTGLLNRRGFDEAAAKTFALARRRNLPVTVILSDIDRFKAINDEHGHEAGDLALRHFTRLMQISRRREDILGRIGGEEFAIILPGTPLDDALCVADLLRSRIEIAPLTYKGGRLPMTASFGVATLSDADESMKAVILRADDALYRSKREGRNRVELESSQALRLAGGKLEPVAN